MIGIIGLLLSLVISLCWYLPCVRAPREAKKEWFLAILLPFLLHGCWDCSLTIAAFCVNRKEVLPRCSAACCSWRSSCLVQYTASKRSGKCAGSPGIHRSPPKTA